MKPPRVLVEAVCLLCVLLLAACATNRKVEAWSKDGQNIGTVTTLSQPDGFTLEYRDLSNRLVRLEGRDSARKLVPGACITLLEYDAHGRPSVTRLVDAQEKPALGPAGFAVHGYQYSSDAEYNVLINEQFLDAENRLVKTRDGFALLRRRQDASGRLKRVEFFDISGAPTPSLWLDVANAARVDYVYLEGIGEVVCAVFFDVSGRVLARRQLSGAVSTANAYSAPPPAGYGPPPVYVPPPRPVAPPPPRLGPR